MATIVTHQNNKRRGIFPYAALIVTLVLYCLLNYGDLVTEATLAWWTNIAWLLFSFGAGFKCLQTARRQTEPTQRHAWFFFAAAASVWFLGMLYWNYLLLVRVSHISFTNLTRDLSIGFALFFVIGMFCYRPKAPAQQYTGAQLTNLGIVFCALATILWVMLLAPIPATQHSFGLLLSSMARAIGHATVLFFALVCVSVYIQKTSQPVFIVLLASFTIHVVADILYYNQSELEQFQITPDYLDIYWLIAFALQYWAAAEQNTPHLAPGNEEPRAWPNSHPRGFGAVVPTASLLLIVISVYVFQPEISIHFLILSAPFVISLILLASLRAWWIDRFRETLIDQLTRSKQLSDQRNLALETQLAEHKAELVEYKRTEQSVKLSRRLKSALFDSALDAVITIDHNGFIIDFNPAAERLFGISQSAAIGKNMTDLIVPQEMRERHRAGLRNYVQTGRSVMLGKWVEMPALKHNGDRFNVELAITVIDGGDTPLFTGILRDITERKRAEQELSNREAQLRLIAENVPAMIAYYGNDRICRYCNKNFADLFGWTADQATGMPLTKAAGKAAYPRISNATEEVLAGKAVNYQRNHLTESGDARLLDVSMIPHIETADTVLGFYVVIHDITEQKQTELEIIEARERLEQALQASSLVLWDIDILHNRVYLSAEWAAMLDGEAKETISSLDVIYRRVHPDDLHNMRIQSRDVVQGRIPEYHLEHRVQAKSGDWIWLLSRGKVIERSADGKALRMTGTSADVTERKAAEDRVRFLAHHDALTKLPNRVLLKDRTEQAIAMAQRYDKQVAIIFIDLDNFKNINDSLGHHVGDLLLREASQRLKDCLREEDTVARQGGDEFIVLIGNLADARDAERVAKKILATLAQPFSIERHTLYVSGSLGISIYPLDGLHSDALLRNADTAMYHAKDAGRNNYQFFTVKMNVEVQQRLSIENQLREALARNELVLYYQPQVDIATGRVVGMEALLRWRHPEQGIIGPNQFIEVAESTGLIVPIGEWVLNEACRQISAWQNKGCLPVQVSVNVSARQFFRPDFYATVAQALTNAQIDSRYLALELTETAVMKHADEATATLAKLERLGVELAIDDFGTGYSSLSYLKRFRIDKLKIDQSFVRDIETDPNGAEIVSAIVAIAKRLRLTVIAEGVETAEQVAFLRRHDCDQAQGYYFSRPRAAASLITLLTASTDLVYAKLLANAQ